MDASIKSIHTACTQCRRRRRCWKWRLFPGTDPVPFCKECLLPIATVAELRRLKNLGLIAIALPPTEAQSFQL